MKDGQGCRAEKSEGWFTYTRDWVLNTGIGAAAGLGPKGNEIPKSDERDVCLIKYSITNNNKIHDLRIQLYDMSTPGDGKHAVGAHKQFIVSITLGLFSILSAFYA